MNKRNVIIIISILTFIVIVGGISYAYFIYNKQIGDISLTAGEISIDLTNVSGNQTLSNMIPMSDIDGMTSTNYFDFTVNSTVDTERIYYEVYIMPDSENTLDISYLKTYLTDQSNNELKGITIFNDLGDSEVENGKVIYKGIIEVNQNGTTKTETKDFRLRIWLDENYTGQASKTFDFDIYLYAKNVDNDFEIPYGVNLVRKAIEEKEAEGGTCSTITWTDQEDNITYLSGTNDCVDMNYVWYSGKLWRITQIYPDGAMKMITENNMTAIAFNESNQVNFYTNSNTTSYAYQWLNEDFYDTLYNPTGFIDTTKQWNATKPADVNISTKPLETQMVSANVGLLNSYEYYNSYRVLGEPTNGFLNLEYNWWLLNPYSSSDVWAIVYNNGKATYEQPSFADGVRPSIYIRSDVEFTGNGTKNNPYQIVGDKKIGKQNDLINTRISGEYVKIKSGNNEELFRIVGIENNKTKIVALDYVDNNATRKFATNVNDTIWGSGTTTGTNTWYTYLNNTYYPSLVSVYGNIFDSNTYYFGLNTDSNYKQSICASAQNVSIKDCVKTSRTGIFNIGLLRYGEMFAAQQEDPSNSLDMWLINEYNVYQPTVWFVMSDDYGGGVANDSSTYEYAARPTLHLKSTVKILSGSGTENDPYVVGL